MTKDQLPEKLRNLQGLEMFDPSKRVKITLGEQSMEILAKELGPRLDRKETA